MATHYIENTKYPHEPNTDDFSYKSRTAAKMRYFMYPKRSTSLEIVVQTWKIFNPASWKQSDRRVG
jgi:hypothetical protein